MYRIGSVKIATALVVMLPIGLLVALPSVNASAYDEAEDTASRSMLTGVIRLASDDSLPASAMVSIEAWPSPEKLADMREGDVFQLRTLGVGRVAHSGEFEIAIKRARSLATWRAMASDSGIVDVDIVLKVGNHTSSYSTSMTSGPGGALSYMALRMDPRTGRIGQTQPLRFVLDRVDSITLRPGTPIGAVSAEAQADRAKETGPESVEARSEQLGSPEFSGVDPATETFPNGCPISSGTRLVKKQGKRWVNVGNVHTKGRGKHMQFEYTRSASTALGVGISATGEYGTFESSGEIERKRVMTVGWPLYKKPKSRYLDTKFKWGKYCTTTRTPAPSFKFRSRAIRHVGGTRHRNVKLPKATYCTPWRSAGSFGRKDQTRAITWTNGAKVSAAIGMDLSSRTGFAKNASQYWVFKRPGRLCGSHDYVGGASVPRIIVMKPPS